VQFPTSGKTLEKPNQKISKGKSMNKEAEFYTPNELADRWRVHPTSIYNLVQDGELAALRIGKKTTRRPALRIPFEAVETYEARQLRK
jgi:excisionase family DNA binding protein